MKFKIFNNTEDLRSKKKNTPETTNIERPHITPISIYKNV